MPPPVGSMRHAAKLVMLLMRLRQAPDAAALLLIQLHQAPDAAALLLIMSQQAPGAGSCYGSATPVVAALLLMQLQMALGAACYQAGSYSGGTPYSIEMQP